MAELLSLEETGRRLGGISKRTVQRLIADRQLRVVKVRRTPFVTLAEVERYVKTRERTS